MILRIDQTANEAIYLQIRNQIVAAIARGELLAGDGLPSVRRLASDLGINLHTVNKAYAVLRDEGYVLMRGRSGAFVADVEQAASAQRRASEEAALSEKLQSLALEYKARGGTLHDFTELAIRAAEIAYADPGIAGARRNVGVLGLDAEGERLGKAGAGASGVSAVTAAAAFGANKAAAASGVNA